MAERGTELPGISEEAAGCCDWKYLVLLLLLTVPLRAWLLFNTEVAARDSIGFIRYALQIESKPWKEALLGNHQHPGYPLAILAVSQPIRSLFGTDPVTMRVSAQLATTLAALALLLPMYYLGKELFDRQVGFWGALIFQYLPVSGHHLSDGISEGLFLFFVAMALWRGVLAVGRYRPREFGWSGLWGGLAFLTRPEGALVVAAVGLVLIGMQLSASRRRAWSSFFACGLSLTVAAAAVASIYVLTIGGLTTKIAPQRMFKPTAAQVLDGSDERATQFPVCQRGQGGPLVASMLGVFIKRADDLPVRLSRSLRALGSEFSHGFHYVGWVLALLGLGWSWSASRREPRFWIVAGFCLLHGAVLFQLAMVESYVSDRHMLVLIMCGAFFTVVGARTVAGFMAAWLARRKPQAGGPSWMTATRFTGVLLAAFVLFCLPKTGQRLHGNRIANHRAGLWLAPMLAAGDMVEDDHAYSHYYAGQVFVEGKEPMVQRGHQPTCYVVITRSRAEEIEEERKKREEELRKRSAVVYLWPESGSFEEARVVIYAQPRDFGKDPWTVAP